MATYGVDYYGLSKYGTATVVEYDVSPFVAMPLDYGSVALTWTVPQADVDRLRLVRNRYGYSVHATDGEIILDTTFIPESFTDTELPHGVQFYYTIFVYLRSEWVRAGVTTTMPTKEAGYGERMYNLLPGFFKYGIRNVGDDVVENEALRSFMNVFGWGFDSLSTQYDSLLRSHDADSVSVENLERLASDLGITYEHAVPARQMRQRVKYSGHIARQKGTLEGLRNLVNTVTGWDAEISTGANLMLDGHQASFIFPHYEDYSPLINYPVGDRVRHQLFCYEAKVGTYGNAPTGTRADTTYWHCIGDADNATWVDGTSNPDWYSRVKNQKTSGISTWEALALTAGVPGGAYTRLGGGIPDTQDPSLETRNAIYVFNAHATLPGDFALRSVSRLTGDSAMDPSQPILDGIPMRSARGKFDVAKTYEKGDVVLFHGRVYRALNQTVGTVPDASGPAVVTADWEPLGIDNRIRYAMSGYTHQPPSFSTGKPSSGVTPYMDYYDERGKLIVSVDAKAYPQVQLDSFGLGWGTVSTGRAMDVGASTYTVSPASGWSASGYKDGVLFPKSTATMATSLVTGLADGQVAVTLRTDAPAGVSQGIIFRYSNATNYLLANRTTLSKKVAGSVTSLGTYSTAFSDGDRMTVKMQGSTITVYRNGTSVLTVTDSFNSTATTHGMAVAA